MNTRSAATVAPYSNKLKMKQSDGSPTWVKRQNCYDLLGRYSHRVDAIEAAHRLANCTRWTAGHLVVLRCNNCRGYHLMMKNREEIA